MTPTTVPRVLLLEDDPVSRAFLTAAVQGVPAEVDGADSVAAASALAQAGGHALWLFDAHLADGCGARLLQDLRPRYPHVPALAHTASADARVREMLLAAGFLEVLVKPLPAATVRHAVRRALGTGDDDTAGKPGHAARGDQPAWDDELAALALNGNRAHVATLRGLFVDDLPRVTGDITAATRDRDFDRARASLHRLRASCGFVGAVRLGAATRALQQRTDSPALLAQFEQAAADTLAAVAAARSDQTGAGQAGADQPAPDQLVPGARVP